MARYITVLRRAAAGFGEDNGTSFAAAIAYYALFSIFPLIVFLLSFIGFFIHDAQQRRTIVDAVFKLLGQSVDKNTLYAQVNAFAGGRAGLGLLGFVVAAWSASAVFGAIRTGLNVVWNVTKTRPLAQTKLLDLGMVLGVGVLLLLSVAATGVLTVLAGFSRQVLGNSLGVLPHLVFALLYVIVPTVIAFLAFALTYYIVPHAEVRFRDTWLGALFAATAFAVAQYGFAFYVSKFAHYDKVYGSLGAVIAFLFFVYISANILLFGGEVTKEYIDLLAGVKPETEPEQTAEKKNLEQTAIGIVKGLFVDESGHHDTSLPYEPGRTQPAHQPAALVKDRAAEPQIKDGTTEKHAAPHPQGRSEGGATTPADSSGEATRPRRSAASSPPIRLKPEDGKKRTVKLVQESQPRKRRNGRH